MTLVKTSPLVDKILNFVLQYSNDNNLIILTGKKSNDLYITNLHPKIASLSVASRHFPSIKELVYYFILYSTVPVLTLTVIFFLFHRFRGFVQILP